MRCESCQKFVSYEGGEEPEVTSEELEVGDEGQSVTISASITLTKRCGECGTDLAEASFDFNESFEIPEDHRGEGHELELTLADPEQTERTQREARNRKTGKITPIRNSRYAKSYYGVEVSYSIQCSCGVEIESGTLDDEIQASGLEPA